MYIVRWAAVALAALAAGALGAQQAATGSTSPACAAATSVWSSTMVLASQAPTPELRTAYQNQVEVLSARRLAACATPGSKPVAPDTAPVVIPPEQIAQPSVAQAKRPPLTHAAADSLLAVARTSADTMAVVARIVAGDTAVSTDTGAAGLANVQPGVKPGAQPVPLAAAAPASGGVTVQTLGSASGAVQDTRRCGYRTVQYLKAMNYAWNTSTLVSDKVRLYEDIMLAKPGYHEACGGSVTYPRPLRPGEGPGEALTSADFR